MNAYPSQPSIPLSRSLTERVLSGVGTAWRMAGALLARWRDRRARRRELRAFDALAHMSEHMLRDIGAHDRLLSHAAARRDAEHRRRISAQLSLPVVALMAVAALAVTGEATASPPSKACARVQMAGVFTGEYVNGAPVYYLPPVTVVASRNGEPRRREREEPLTRAEQARPKAAARPPA